MRTCDHSITPVRPTYLGKPWCIFSSNLSADALDDPIFPAGHPHYFGLAGGMIDAPDLIPAGSTLGHAMPAFPDSPQVAVPEFVFRGD